MVGFGLLLLVDTFTQIAFKLASAQAGEFSPGTQWLSATLDSPWLYGALAGYLGAFAIWMTLLKHAPVGPAFAASHLEVVTVLVASYFLFGERLTVMQIVGGVCIVLGILCLSRSAAPPADA